MKRKLADERLIPTVNFMIKNSDNPKVIIKELISQYQLTPEFMTEFYRYFDKEMFTLSYKLSTQLVDMFPDLFDWNLLKTELINYKNSQDNIKKESEEKLNNLKNMLSNGIKNRSEVRIKMSDLTVSNVKQGLPPTYLSISMAVRYWDELKKEDLITEDDFKVISRDSITKELTKDVLLKVIGHFDNEVDEIVISKIPEELRDEILSNISSNKNSNLTAFSYGFLSNKKKEEMLAEKGYKSDEFIKLLVETEDLGWQIKMINDVVSGTLKLEKTTGNMDEDLINLTKRLPEKTVVLLTKLSSYLPNAFSYRVLSEMLTSKSFTEDQIIEMSDLFKKSGLYFNLLTLAKKNNWNKLMEVLK